ncbi:hypothetical protein PUNSTDRAFT_42492 [Punctularia strigosozonata HHB-11173 SS5]|uniref:uncharacterized protein n=1 Tax=Punctularia strigosozonata (strain HHB-11173) TaxID=741275 RepID=UPI0004417BA4|nr:uncharacterized protein PUNSTDRAFT_42492 [Punctularia strigosozonata HHB-11173 SS5]EIN11138.1 hypothetical protein PUNSTDRAFT_42492 [Punctularia strigosozonata HHB-11173 SS5]
MHFLSTVSAYAVAMAVALVLVEATPAPVTPICFGQDAGCSPNIFPTCCAGLSCVQQIGLPGQPASHRHNREIIRPWGSAAATKEVAVIARAYEVWSRHDV